MATPLNQPLVLEPYLRPMPWGGDRLGKWLARPIPPGQRIGEAWLVSDHALHQSRVTGGPWDGVTLRQLVTDRSVELLGRQVERFPLLVKLLDARENLSVQVHPDDELARKWAPTEGGKSEAWLVLESDPGALVYLGLKPGVDKSLVAREAERDTLPLCLQKHEPQPGQVYNVPAGTIHALGGGLVVLEVQQTSDATFRLYDWGRVDAQGKPRTLHLEAGLACLKERPIGAGPQPTGSGCLVQTPYFALHRLEQESVVAGPTILVTLAGRAQLLAAGCRTPLNHGQTALIPAAADSITIKPDAGALVAQVAVVCRD